MAVFRVEKTRDYTVMANHHLRNTELSLKAKGLLSLMLSLPEEWDYTTKGLARICKDGVDSICAGVRELEEHGYLTAKYVSFTPAEMQAELETLFQEQYRLNITESIEIRYRTEEQTVTTIDPETGEEITTTELVEVPYEYKILSVELQNRGIPTSNLSAEQSEMYAVLMETRGNEPELFDAEDNPFVGSLDITPPTPYEIPPAALADPQFAALIREAEKYLGYPYVWGGSKPSTSFDCSGFTCWVLNQSGTASVGRTNARGLYKRSTVVSRAEAKPCDLIFFTGARAAQIGHPVTHVGIYVGNGMMIHCAGNGVEYHTIDSKYYKKNFYSESELREVIASRKLNIPNKTAASKPNKQINLLVDIQAKLQAGKGPGYERWAKTFNLKQMAHTLNYLTENNLLSYEALSEKAAEANARFHALSAQIKAAEKRMAEIAMLRTHIINYSKTRDVYVAYRKAGYSKKFYEEHTADLLLHKAAKQAFDALASKKLPTVKALNTEYSELLSAKKKAFTEYTNARAEMREVLIVKANMASVLRCDNMDAVTRKNVTDQICR